MQPAFPYSDNAGRVVEIGTISAQNGIKNVPEPRPDDADGQHPDQCVPNAFAVLTAASELAFNDQRPDNDADHHDHAIPAQGDFQAAQPNGENYRINHVYLKWNFHRLYRFAICLLSHM